MNSFKIPRRAFAALALTAPLFAPAQDTRPIEWVVGYPAGGGSDAVARVVAEQMAKTLGASIIVNNKPGAATNIAAEYVARSKAPGQILFTADFATLAANPSLFAKLPYDPDKDFVPVGLIARFPLILVVGPAVPATNFKDFIAWVKSSKDPVSYASSGVGSPQHLAGELFAEKSGLKLQHVPYRGGAPAVQDLIGGQVPFALMDSATVVQHLQSGKLRAPRRRERESGQGSAQHSDAGRTGPARRRGVRMARPRGTGGHAARSGRRLRQGAALSTRIGTREGSLSGARHRDDARTAAADERFRQGRTHALGRVDQGRQHQARLNPRRSKPCS
jgi:tripartite-type tricarboxylate transporter receptor subunit TctC